MERAAQRENSKRPCSGYIRRMAGLQRYETMGNASFRSDAASDRFRSKLKYVFYMLRLSEACLPCLSPNCDTPDNDRIVQILNNSFFAFHLQIIAFFGRCDINYRVVIIILGLSNPYFSIYI